MKRIFWIILLSIIFLMVVGCSQPLVETTEVDWFIPNAGETTGIVQGLLLNDADEKPVRGIPYLSRNLSSKDPEMPATISFSLQSDPRAFVNEITGEFYFKDIDPGDNYVIVLHYGPGEFLVVQDEETQYPVMIEVVPGKSNDIGTIYVQEP